MVCVVDDDSSVRAAIEDLLASVVLAVQGFGTTASGSLLGGNQKAAHRICEYLYSLAQRKTYKSISGMLKLYGITEQTWPSHINPVQVFSHTSDG